MAKIFISYRRADSETIVGRIYDRLISRFGTEAIFKDVDSIPLGLDFKQYVGSVIRQCGVALVIIGPRWLGITDSQTGRRRLDDLNDNVRLEIEAAIAANILIIPLLVEHATMPDVGHLPKSLHPLVLRNGRPVRNDPDFNHDIGAVLAALEQHVRGVDMPPGAAVGTSSAADAQGLLLRQMLTEIEHAYAAQDWHAVADKSALLLRRAPGAAGIRLLHLYGHALVELGDASTAAPLLQDALALASTPAERLDILRQYVAALQALNRWSDVLARCDEALRVAPDEPSWTADRLDALAHLGRSDDALAAAHQLTNRPNATAADWVTLARVIATATHNNRGEIRAALDDAGRRFRGDVTLAAARSKLLPPLVPRERFPERLERFGFRIGERDGVGYIIPLREHMCVVSIGPFLMGSSQQSPDVNPYDFIHQQPQHQVTAGGDHIGKFPVTVAEYSCFVASGHPAPSDWGAQSAKLDHPVVNVSWHDAMAYAAWLSKLTGDPWKLPTEAEWEKAARWDPQNSASRLFPWGDRFESTRCNTAESFIRGTTPVGSYGPEDPSRDGSSPCGAQDMAGNVWEWTSSVFKTYPYRERDGRENPNARDKRTIRGGSWEDWARSALCASRTYLSPDHQARDVGFRLVNAYHGRRA